MAPVKPMNCIFCNPAPEDIVAHNDLFYAKWDKFPVNRGHVIPRNTGDIPEPKGGGSSVVSGVTGMRTGDDQRE